MIWKGENIPHSCNDALNMLYLVEGIGEIGLRVNLTVDTRPEQEVRCGVKCILHHHVENVDLGSGTQILHQNLHMFFEDVQIAQTVLDELRSEQLSRVVPYISVYIENAYAKQPSSAGA